MINNELAVMFPARQYPPFVISEARQNKVADRFLIHAWGGLGDQICAIPAIEFAMKNYRRYKFYLATKNPELFSHLKFDGVFDLRKDTVDPRKFITINCMADPQHLLWTYCSHMVCHAVDFPAMLMWQRTLPNADKEIHLPDFPITDQLKPALKDPQNTVVLHFGASMPSKTLPTEWCARLVAAFQTRGFKTVLIGKQVTETIGYVKFNSETSLDLRDKLSLEEFICLLKNSAFVFSNDSSPIHAAAAGDAFIGMVSSIKHPDYLFHWRKGQFGYKTKNFGLTGAWERVDGSPVLDETLDHTELLGVTWDEILPPPSEVAEYYSRLRGS